MFKSKIKNIIRSIFKREFNLNVNNQIKNNNYFISKNKVSNNKYKIKIITSYNDEYKEVGDKTKETLKKYAQIQGYDFENIVMPKTGRPYAWNKISILMNEIKKRNFEYSMWIDADAYFNNYDIDISSEIEQNKENL